MVRLLAGAGALAAGVALVFALGLPSGQQSDAPALASDAAAVGLLPLDGEAARSLAEILAAAGDEALELIPEGDGFGLDGLTDEELLAMDSYLYGG